MRYPCVEYRSFNSKLVRLKAQAVFPVERYFKSFNSKLVRLKGKLILNTFVPPSTFQFQTGAIKRHSHRAVIARVSCVSIPNWCD